ncbi:MAG: rhodanese-related sulfurtransferase [Planctomycetes bacterium]|nr:rhodanese-related sulfurtransferase [Planctomycetota bacterium]
MTDFLVAALYKFVALPDYQDLRKPLLQACVKNHVKGTLLLATEGINGTIAGPVDGVRKVVEFLRRDPRFLDLEIKQSHAASPPFHRMKVRLKKEIVTMGVPGIDPNQIVGTYVDPESWNALLEDPEVIVIDTRNDYEVAIGTFRGATNPELKTFRDFPDWLRKEFAKRKNPKVAMFCTGGIRCEKSTAFLKEEGVKEVFHLHGGILKYLENVPEDQSLWEGECFVFDQRVSVKHGLEVGSYTLCRACRNPISESDCTTAEFVDGVSCPHCHAHTTAEQKAGFAERQKQMELASARLEAMPVLYSFRRCPYAMRARLALSVSEQACVVREVALKNRPEELYAASSKGTVPVLVLANGEVIDESLAVMQWALQQRDPEGWLPSAGHEKEMRALIASNDGDFKFHLDRYKYATRYEGVVAEEHRDKASAFLQQLDQRLQDSAYLFGEQPSLADMAIAPFVRQFSIADSAWFQQQPWPRLIAWLEAFINSPRFASIMTKRVTWEQTHDPLIVDWRLP